MDINRNPYYIRNLNAMELEEKYRQMQSQQSREQSPGISAGNIANITGGALATTAATMDAVNSYRDIARARPDKMVNPYTSIRYGDDPGEFRQQDNPFKTGEGFRQGLSDAGKMAGAGAALGSAIGTAVTPGVGTAIGGAIGAGTGLIGGTISGIKKGQANARQRRRFNSLQEKARENFDFSKDAFNENQRQLDLSAAQNNYYKNPQGNFLSE
jgi:hypothetical protein